jgi:NitT/TauT family transport system ATP-binding protein
MSNRPGRVKHTMPIDLPRPRSADILTSVQYLQYKQEALEVLHSEAMKAFAGGSKAAADFLEAYASRSDETA